MLGKFSFWNRFVYLILSGYWFWLKILSCLILRIIFLFFIAKDIYLRLNISHGYFWIRSISFFFKVPFWMLLDFWLLYNFLLDVILRILLCYLILVFLNNILFFNTNSKRKFLLLLLIFIYNFISHLSNLCWKSFVFFWAII